MDWGVAAATVPQLAPYSRISPEYWVFGTPAYMPPEQACGHAESPDRRSDVFGLGGILCEILTGQPPYVGVDATAVTRMAANADQKEMARRLANSRADPVLIELTRRCLCPDRRRGQLPQPKSPQKCEIISCRSNAVPRSLIGTHSQPANGKTAGSRAY